LIKKEDPKREPNGCVRGLDTATPVLTLLLTQPPRKRRCFRICAHLSDRPRIPAHLMKNATWNRTTVSWNHCGLQCYWKAGQAF